LESNKRYTYFFSIFGLGEVNLSKKKILEHELVPLHEVLPEEEVSLILKKYGIAKEQLPKILSDDPVVKAIGAKEGQVLKITRKSPTVHESIYYRLVV